MIVLRTLRTHYNCVRHLNNKPVYRVAHSIVAWASNEALESALEKILYISGRYMSFHRENYRLITSMEVGDLSDEDLKQLGLILVERRHAELLENERWG